MCLIHQYTTSTCQALCFMLYWLWDCTKKKRLGFRAKRSRQPWQFMWDIASISLMWVTLATRCQCTKHKRLPRFCCGYDKKLLLLFLSLPLALRTPATSCRCHPNLPETQKIIRTAKACEPGVQVYLCWSKVNIAGLLWKSFPWTWPYAIFQS